ncbi:class C beta-lactamase-related serine hydrolase [Prolixibacteraceae bacterium JC049]|nr:class C beta-lactamase-related serine hydrolase [Prolixibacteraceae bacterium JC049]
MFKNLSLIIVMILGIVTISSFYSRSGCEDKLSPLEQLKKSADKIELVRNRDNLLPLVTLDTLKLGYFTSSESDLLLETLRLYTKTEKLNSNNTSSNLSVIKVENKSELDELKNLNKTQKWIVLTSFDLVDDIPESVDAVFAAEELGEKELQLIPQMIFGARKVTNGNAKIKTLDRLGYTLPEAHGIDHQMLSHRLDSLVNLGLDSAAFPGCQILVAKEGDVIFHKTYGFTTYDKTTPVKKEMLYDWASVTKITGPLPLLMKLEEERKIDLDQPFSKYWKLFKKSNKRKLTLREILAHQAGLPSWLPYWTETRKKSGKFKCRYVRDKQWRKAAEQFSDSLWVNHRFHKQIYKDIAEAPLLKSKKYKYSGLSFFVFPELISQIMKEDYEKALQKYFTASLGAYSVVFNPLKHGYKKEQIVPTEYDSVFRKQQIHGWVHDEGAAIMGGISGNAGLFGSTNDLAKMMQMYMQMGHYGGKEYLKKKTMKKFTQIQYPENENRRGLGFDKPYIDNNENELIDAYPAVSTSKNSFGHSGFTGTFAWADPDEELLFIFMSNRVYPTRNNSKLYDLNLRPQLHQAIYDCLNSYTKNK